MNLNKSKLDNENCAKGADLRLVRGQVMLLTVLLLSGTILSATTIAGLLMLYQIRQATDIANSTKAIYAADTGIERRVYDIFLDPASPCSLSEPSLVGSLDNGAKFTVSCDRQRVEPAVNVAGSETLVIKSTGEASKNFRALETILARPLPPPPPPAP